MFYDTRIGRKELDCCIGDATAVKYRFWDSRTLCIRLTFVGDLHPFRSWALLSSFTHLMIGRRTLEACVRDIPIRLLIIIEVSSSIFDFMLSLDIRHALMCATIANTCRDSFGTPIENSVHIMKRIWKKCNALRVNLLPIRTLVSIPKRGQCRDRRT